MTSILLMCSRHPVRHISFNSHSLITAHVPYESVARDPDLDHFTTHRRSVLGWVDLDSWVFKRDPLSLILSLGAQPFFS